jgi:hypothetical protein
VIWLTIKLVIGIWWGTAIGYLAIMHAHAVQQRGEKITLWVKIPMYGLIPPFLVLDTLFNLVYGSVIFKEPPKQFLFTDRLKDIIRERKPGRRLNKAVEWALILNKYDPDHVRIPSDL